MVDIIVLLILFAIIVPIICYIVKTKKNGQACIGCPSSSKCRENCHCNQTHV